MYGGGEEDNGEKQLSLQKASLTVSAKTTMEKQIKATCLKNPQNQDENLGLLMSSPVSNATFSLRNILEQTCNLQSH